MNHLVLFNYRLIFFFVAVVCTGVVQRKRNQVRHELEKAGKNREEIADDLYPRIHGVVFNPADGILRPLKIDFEKRVGSLDQIYGLYEKGL